MNDIFVSYANADREIAHELADALEAHGWSVWWDREIPFGKPFDQVIEEELSAARCVVVLWSEHSVRSRWVKIEAAAAADRDRLIPVQIEDVALPLEFRRIQTAMLHGWRGDRSHPEFLRLVDSVRHMLGDAPTPASSAALVLPPKNAPGPGRRKRAFAYLTLALGVLALIYGAMQLRGPGAEAPASSAGGSPEVPAPAAANAPPSGERALNASASVSRGFPIRIGDTIEDGVPATGAGNIERSGAKDAYTFDATAHQRVYFRMLEHGRGMQQIKWRLTDPDGAEVFDTCLGCGEAGLHVLRKAGTYILTIGSDRDAATGPYRIRLYDVAPPQRFTIRIGDMVKENAPAPGAGAIETPGAQDIYTFTAAPRQQVYFRMFEFDRDMSQIGWLLTDADDNEIFMKCLGCGEGGVQTLRKGGQYTLAVGARAVPAVGAYRLQLLDVPPPQRFTVSIGDTLGENAPGRGAGDIESPGAQDVYAFPAAAGQRVHFQMLEHGRDMSQITWKLIDPDGNDVFETCLGCGAPGAHTLRKAGTYTLTVGSHRVPATGPYRLRLSHAAAP